MTIRLSLWALSCSLPVAKNPVSSIFVEISEIIIHDVILTSSRLDQRSAWTMWARNTADDYVKRSFNSDKKCRM